MDATSESTVSSPQAVLPNWMEQQGASTVTSKALSHHGTLAHRAEAHDLQ